MTLQYNVITPRTQVVAGAPGGLPWFGAVQFGFDTTTNFALTPNGLAICRQDGSCVAIDRDEDSLLDVTPLVMTGINPAVIRLPLLLPSLRKGDLLITSDSPFSALFVLGVEEESRVRGLDPITGEFVVYSPPRGLLFNVVVVAMSLYAATFLGRRPSGEDENPEPQREGLREALLLALFSQTSPSAASGGGTPTPVAGSLLGGATSSLWPLLLLGGNLWDGDDRGRRGNRQLLLLLLLTQLMAPTGVAGAPSQAPAPATTVSPLLALLPLLGGLGRGDDDHDGRHQHGFRDLLLVLALTQGFAGTGSPQSSPGASAALNPMLMFALLAGFGDGDEASERSPKPEEKTRGEAASKK